MKPTEFALELASQLADFNAVAIGNLILIPNIDPWATIENIAGRIGIDDDLVFVWPYNHNYFAIETPE